LICVMDDFAIVRLNYGSRQFEDERMPGQEKTGK